MPCTSLRKYALGIPQIQHLVRTSGLRGDPYPGSRGVVTDVEETPVDGH